MDVRSRRLLQPAMLVLALLTIPTVAQGAWWSSWWTDPIAATGHDAITTPGQAVDLGAKFERDLWGRPDLTNRAVTFTQPLTASARTDRDGVARIRVRANSTGVYSIAAHVDGHSRSVAQSRLFVLDPNRPVVICDIVGTISDLPEWQVPFAAASAPTFPGAVSLLTELSQTHTIVYLTARDDMFDSVSRRFLARHGFPDGPVLYNDMGLTSLNELSQFIPHAHGDFKLEVLRNLMARGVNVALGIGNAETDGFAYENAGIPSFLNTNKTGSGPSFRFMDFQHLRLELIGRGIL